MRQLMIMDESGGDQAVEILETCGGVNIARIPLRDDGGKRELIIVQVPNSSVGPIIDRLQEIGDTTVTITPQGTMPLKPPASEAPDQVKDVSDRSPVEIFLSGLQSIGSWKGFLLYAAAGGMVAWIGLYSNTIYLLVAAMLIAPFAGPAMNAAIGTARGDWQLLRQGLIRYFASLGLAIVVSAAMSLAMRQEIATSTMVSVSQISVVAVLLALTAGAAGASNLVQSERNSLVSGAAVGMLVAASLAPPASVIGMSMVIGRWGMAMDGLFLLLLQLTGINLAGALTFRLYGMSPSGVRYPRGTPWVSTAALTLSFFSLIVLLTVQHWDKPSLQRSTISTRAEQVIQEVVEGSGAATLIEASARFPRPSAGAGKTLLCVVYVRPSLSNPHPHERLSERLRASIRESLSRQEWGIEPVVEVRVLP
jgi:uncharacterized hydrophobic protein (TIGR00341 family)